MAAHPANTSGPINPNNPCEYQLYHVLERANLLGYFTAFVQQGGDDVGQLCESSDQEFGDILTLVGMANKPLHIRRLQKSLQEWAKDNNVPFLQSGALPPAATAAAAAGSAAAAAAHQQAVSMGNSLPYASALVGMQPPQGHGVPMGGQQWGPAVAGQWNAGQPLAAGDDSPRQSSPYAQPGMTHPQSQRDGAGTSAANNSSSSSATKSSTPKCTDIRTLRHVAQRIMATHTPTPLRQTNQNKKILHNVQHIMDMPPEHPQRMEEIQKWAPIYGRFDSKRKDDKPLTAHEITVNEAAIIICCIDPYLLVQRDKLFPLARQVVRESGYQFKHGHSRSVKVTGRSASSSSHKAKRLRTEASTSSYQHTEVTNPNPRTVQAEILKLRREERMNEILRSLTDITQKQSEIKASIAAARAEDNIQRVYDLKVQLEKLTTQQLLLMTEQTDLIKRQRRSDRYYVAKARAESESADLANSDTSSQDASQVSDPETDNHSGTFLQAPSSAEPGSPAIEGARTPPTDKQPGRKATSSSASLAQTFLMQQTLMNEGLRVAQNYAMEPAGRAGAAAGAGGPASSSSAGGGGSPAAPAGKGAGATPGEGGGGRCQQRDSREEAASLAAESTITALLNLSSGNHKQLRDGRPDMDL